MLLALVTCPDDARNVFVESENILKRSEPLVINGMYILLVKNKIQVNLDHPCINHTYLTASFGMSLGGLYLLVLSNY
jgi:hypothetical protein